MRERHRIVRIDRGTGCALLGETGVAYGPWEFKSPWAHWELRNSEEPPFRFISELLRRFFLMTILTGRPAVRIRSAYWFDMGELRLTKGALERHEALRRTARIMGRWKTTGQPGRSSVGTDLKPLHELVETTHGVDNGHQLDHGLIVQARLLRRLQVNLRAVRAAVRR